MAFWTDPSNVFLKQSHRWVISFPEIYSGDSGKDSIKQYFKPTAFAKSVDRPTMSMKTVQAKYLYAHTFNFPTRYVWNPIKITFYDILLKNEKVKPTFTTNPGPTDNIFVYYKNPVINNDLKYVIAGEGGLQNYNYYLQSTQYFFQTLLQTSGYTVPNEFDAVDKLIRFRDYNFKDSLASHFSGHVKKDGRYENNYIIIKEIDELGKTIEEWHLYNPIITEVTPSKLDYSSDEALTITIGVTYDWAEFHPTMLVDDELKKKAEEEAKKAEEEQEKKRAKEEAKKEAEERAKKQAEKEAEEKKKKTNTLYSIDLEVGTIGGSKDFAQSVCQAANVKMFYYDESGNNALKTVNNTPEVVIAEISTWISLVDSENDKRKIQAVITELKRCAEAATPPAAVPATAAAPGEESQESESEEEESQESESEEEESEEEEEEAGNGANIVIHGTEEECVVRIMIINPATRYEDYTRVSVVEAIQYISSLQATEASKKVAIEEIKTRYQECFGTTTPEARPSAVDTVSGKEEKIPKLQNVVCNTSDDDPCTGADIVFYYAKYVEGEYRESLEEVRSGENAEQVLGIIESNKSSYGTITSQAQSSIEKIIARLKACEGISAKSEPPSAASPEEPKPAEEETKEEESEEGTALGNGYTYSIIKIGDNFKIVSINLKGVERVHREFNTCEEAHEEYEYLKESYRGATFGPAPECESAEEAKEESAEESAEEESTEESAEEKPASESGILDVIGKGISDAASGLVQGTLGVINNIGEFFTRREEARKPKREKTELLNVENIPEGGEPEPEPTGGPRVKDFETEGEEEDGPVVTIDEKESDRRDQEEQARRQEKRKATDEKDKKVIEVKVETDTE